MIYYSEKKKIYTIFYVDKDNNTETTAGKVIFKNADEAIGGAKAILTYNLDISYLCVYELIVPASDTIEPTRELIWECIAMDDGTTEFKEKEDPEKKYS